MVQNKLTHIPLNRIAIFKSIQSLGVMIYFDAAQKYTSKITTIKTSYCERYHYSGVTFTGHSPVYSKITQPNSNYKVPELYITGPLCWESIGNQWIPRTKDNDA